jgi:apolipoprotein D and lipocalin family protein
MYRKCGFSLLQLRTGEMIFCEKNGAMQKALIFLVLVLPLFFGGCAARSGNSMKPLETVKFVDLSRYTGQWYEIARYHHRFQEGCVGSRATYSLRADGRIDVLNECYDKSFSGKLRAVKGKARVVDKETNSRLKVSFFWPFAGDYWIIDLGRDYEYAVVGHPDRKYLWILSRTPEMDEGVYQAILKRLQEQGYDTAKLVRTAQKQGD